VQIGDSVAAMDSIMTHASAADEPPCSDGMLTNMLQTAGSNGHLDLVKFLKVKGAAWPLSKLGKDSKNSKNWGSCTVGKKRRVSYTTCSV
jgi:hypothetical protein